jgi:hypothetical protein
MLAYMSLVRSILESGSWCWDTYRDIQMNALDHLHKKANKFESHARNLVWENMAQRSKIQRICFVFKAYMGKRACKSIVDSLKGPCCLSRHDHGRKIRVKEKITYNSKYVFESKTIKMWNQLAAEALATFSSKLHIMRKRLGKVIINEER